MPTINVLGDLEIKDARTMRALAHPVRLAILERLQRHGPANAVELASQVGTTPAATRRHLRALDSFGLAARDPRQRTWRALASGIRFEPSDDAESQAAYRALGREMFMRADQLPTRWLGEFEPQLEPEWRKVSGFTHARVQLTLEEAEALDAQMERMLEPYVTRNESDAPAGSRAVRVLRYLLPETG